ncbi:intercellular trafficking and secretion, partial [Tulasnella sp. 403]
MDDNDVFDSVTWESANPSPAIIDHPLPGNSTGYKPSPEETGSEEVKWEGYLIPLVSDPVKELEGTKDMYVSYLVSTK